MHVVSFVLFDQFFRYDPLGDAPNKIHLSMRRTQSQTRFKNQQYAAVEKEQCSD